MNQDEKRELQNRLIAMGGKGVMLNDGELCQMFARLVEDFHGDKHWFYRGMLNECEPDKLRDMYDSLKPKFTSFKPLPLETYIAQIADDASRMVSHGIMRVEGKRPDSIQIGEHYYVAATEQTSTHVVIKLTCFKCTKQLLFVGETMVDAMQKARKKGWVRDLSNDKDICPKCQAPRPAGRAGNA